MGSVEEEALNWLNQNYFYWGLVDWILKTQAEFGKETTVALNNASISNTAAWISGELNKSA